MPAGQKGKKFPKRGVLPVLVQLVVSGWNESLTMHRTQGTMTKNQLGNPSQFV